MDLTRFSPLDFSLLSPDFRGLVLLHYTYILEKKQKIQWRAPSGDGALKLQISVPCRGRTCPELHTSIQGGWGTWQVTSDNLEVCLECCLASRCLGGERSWFILAARVIERRMEVSWADGTKTPYRKLPRISATVVTDLPIMAFANQTPARTSSDGENQKQNRNRCDLLSQARSARSSESEVKEPNMRTCPTGCCDFSSSDIGPLPDPANNATCKRCNLFLPCPDLINTVKQQAFCWEPDFYPVLVLGGIVLSLRGCRTPAQYWIKILHPWVQKFYPVLGLGLEEVSKMSLLSFVVSHCSSHLLPMLGRWTTTEKGKNWPWTSPNYSFQK